MNTAPTTPGRRTRLLLQAATLAGAGLLAYVLAMVLIGALYNTWEATLTARAGSLAFTRHNPDLPGLLLQLQDPDAPPAAQAPPASELLPLPVHPDLYGRLYTLTPPGSNLRHLAVAVEVIPHPDARPVIAVAAIPARTLLPETLALAAFILCFTVLPALLLVLVWPDPQTPSHNPHETPTTPA